MRGPAYGYGSDVLQSTLRQRLAPRAPDSTAVFATRQLGCFKLARREGGQTLECFLQVLAAWVANEFAQLTDWETRPE